MYDHEGVESFKTQDVHPHCNLDNLSPDTMSNFEAVGPLKTRPEHTHCKPDTMMPEAICNLDMAMEFVNDDARVVTRKGNSDGGIYGAIDVLASRGVSSRSSDNQSYNIVSKSHLWVVPLSGTWIDIDGVP
jgi:hypothetical protein